MQKLIEYKYIPKDINNFVHEYFILSKMVNIVILQYFLY